ncbi:NAD-dependent epimerase/dehydratase family protein [Halovenus sp. HT40]|uniref:NAD-dependent epimerase/dehydratase family protein n=1 Tax=Halovenus sp. HT40 TaxID=3126691 RepID=UPI00300EA258
MATTMDDRNVLVTGGCGYIGSALVPQLQDAEETQSVVVFDSLTGGSPANLMDADVGNGLEFRQGDVRNYGEVESAMRGVDSVIHLAAITGAASTHDRREETFAVNLEGTRNVLNAAEKLGVETVTFASSCNNYGRAPHENVDETTEPHPINPYAESKLQSEELLAEFDGNATALRLSTNYGYARGIRFNLVVNTFVFRALTNRPLTVYGDGSNWRPFMHVEDAARAFTQATLEPESWPESIYNVGANSENYRISEIAEIVHDEVGTGVDITYLEDEHPGPSYHVNFDRVETTGYEPEYTLREGVRELATAFTSGDLTENT